VSHLWSLAFFDIFWAGYLEKLQTQGKLSFCKRNLYF
jgi:hypothetical protein